MKATMMKMIALLALMVPVLALADEPTSKPATGKGVVEKPAIVTREQWGSKPLPMPDSRKHTPKYITIHHAGTEWKTGKDPAVFVKSMQQWGQKEKHWPD